MRGGRLHHDPVAQSAEQLPFKQWVRGSNPRRVTRKPTRVCVSVFCIAFDVREPRPTVMSGGCRCAESRTDIPAARMRMALAPARPGFESPPGHQKGTPPVRVVFLFGASLLRKLILRGNLKAGGTRLRFPLQTSPSLRATENFALFNQHKTGKATHKSVLLFRFYPEVGAGIEKFPHFPSGLGNCTGNQEMEPEEKAG